MKKPEEKQITGAIPDDFIPDAGAYMLGSTIDPDAKLIKIGGRIMMGLVREQMLAENVVSIHGVGKLKCIILVDYTSEQIFEFMKNARIKLHTVSN